MEHRDEAADRAVAVVTSYPMQHETVVTSSPISAPPAEFYHDQTHNGYPISAPPAEFYHDQTHNGYPISVSPAKLYHDQAPKAPLSQSLSINLTSTTTSTSIDNRRLTAGICRKFIILSTTIIALLLLCMVLFNINNWKVHAPEFSVVSVTVDPLNISSSSHDITSDWLVIFSVNNVNEQKVHYKNIQTSILFKNEIICSGTLENFSIDACHLDDDYCRKSGGAKNLLEHQMAALSVNVNQTVAEILVSAREKGSVIFTFELNAGLAMDNPYGFGHEIRRQMAASCDLEIDFVSSITQAGKLWVGLVQFNVDL